MNFFRKQKKPIKQPQINTYAAFWDWFTEHETHFFQVIEHGEDIEPQFMDILSPMLSQLNEDFYFVVGMPDDETAELIITAEGDLKILPYVEELISAAPKLSRWQFTAHKPPHEPGFSIEMNGRMFNDKTIKFAVEEDSAYPDEINLLLVYLSLKK